MCYLALIVSAVRWLALLWRQRRALTSADVVVTMNTPRAFGTLFATIDDTRRLHADRNVVLLYQRETSGHNPLLEHCFSDLTVASILRRKLTLTLAGRTVELPPDEWNDPMAFALTTWWVGHFGKADALAICGFDIWHSLPIPEASGAVLPRVTEKPPMRFGPFKAYCKQGTAYRPGSLDIINELHMYGGWNTVRAQTPAPKMRLPKSLRQDIYAALEAARGSRAAKLCGLHTRFGGLTDKTHRDGSPVELYIPAIRSLVERGYQVLIQGDRSLHPNFLNLFDGMVVDVDLLGVDRNAFRLFCGTESDVFIGDWPVAPQLAATNGIPTLVVNAWPVGWGINGTTVYYRGICGADGRRWDSDRTLRDGPLLSCNTTPHHFPELFGGDDALVEELRQVEQIPLEEDELLEAVVDFIDGLGLPVDEQSSLTERLPLWTPFRMSSDCRLSPVWIRRYVDTVPRAAELAAWNENDLSQSMAGR